MLELEPEAPTSLEGWSVQDLAVHLYLREHRPDAALGMFLTPFARHTERTARRVSADLGFEGVVEAWAAGPPKLLKPVDARMNTAENFIHHEDVRRAQHGWQPRALPEDAQQALLTPLKTIGAMLVSPSTAPVIAYPSGLPRVVLHDQKGVARAGDDVVRIRGNVGEILLHLFGRQSQGLDLEGNVHGLRLRKL